MTIPITLSPEQMKDVMNKITQEMANDGTMKSILADPSKTSFTRALDLSGIHERAKDDALLYKCVRDLDDEEKLLLATYWMMDAMGW